LNGGACLGSTFGFVISVEEFSPVGQISIILAIYLISVPPTAWVVFTQVKETAHGTHLSGDKNYEQSDVTVTSDPEDFQQGTIHLKGEDSHSVRESTE
jgi:hypothetical protein